MVPKVCAVCGGSLERDDPTLLAHRACFVDWSGREAFAKEQFDLLLAPKAASPLPGVPPAPNRVLYRTDTLAAVILGGKSRRTKPDDRGWLDHLVFGVRHVRALDTIFISPPYWTDWVRGTGPNWSEYVHPDDRALFALERPALCEALPDIAAVLASPAYRGFIEYARTLAQLLTSETYQSFVAEHDAAQEARRDAESRAERKADVITHNALARSAAAGRCPRCAATDLRRVAPADHRRAYYSCLGCGRTFGADLL